jgi:hypothetical protein
MSTEKSNANAETCYTVVPHATGPITDKSCASSLDDAWNNGGIRGFRGGEASGHDEETISNVKSMCSDSF